MKKNLFPLLLLAASTTFAKDAETAETPEQIVQKLYRVYQEENATENGASFEDYASDEIKALFAKDEQLAGGEMGCIDYERWTKTPSQQPSKISMSRPPSPTNSTARRENARLPTYSNQAGKTNRRALSKNPWRIVWRMWKRMAQRNSPLRQAQGSSRVGLAPPFNQILARC